MSRTIKLKRSCCRMSVWKNKVNRSWKQQKKSDPTAPKYYDVYRSPNDGEPFISNEIFRTFPDTITAYTMPNDHECRKIQRMLKQRSQRQRDERSKFF